MKPMNDWALKFVRWGMGLTIVGLLTGYLPLGHYLMKDSLPSCPIAPVHAHTVLLSFVGMPMFGLLYRMLPDWAGASAPPPGLVRAHFWLAVAGVLGVSINGTIGYEILELFVQQDFYYSGPPAQAVRNLWFGIDGIFLTLYAVGCAILVYIFMRHTRYSGSAAA
jgi:hypothetical protein